MSKYKEFVISYNPKPIPDRRFDWDFVCADYDGESNLYGYGSSAFDCMQQIKEINDDALPMLDDLDIDRDNAIPSYWGAIGIAFLLIVIAGIGFGIRAVMV